jgi:hypothetical protein
MQSSKGINHNRGATVTDRHIKILFYAAAIFNWVACLVFIEPLGLAKTLNLSHAVSNDPFGQIALLAIAIFGFGYWMVVSNPAAYRGVVILGLIGKIGVVAIAFGHYFFVGDVNLNLAGLTLGDVIFAAFFFRYLKATSG